MPSDLQNSILVSVGFMVRGKREGSHSSAAALGDDGHR